jgi:hypothetical protein
MSALITKLSLGGQSLSTFRTPQLQLFTALKTKLGPSSIVKLALWAFHFFSFKA